MSIIDTFDSKSAEIFSARDVMQPNPKMPETLIVTFDDRFTSQLSEMLTPTVACVLSAAYWIPVYSFEYNGRKLGFFCSTIGGAAAVGLLEELHALGAKKVLYFGSCGSLDKDITAGHLLVPTAAYRDEGTSYHYAPPSDFIEVQSADRLAVIFDELSVPYIKTKTWTTDAVYRETQDNMHKRKSEGCSVVEMECASIMAAAQFRGYEVYQFLYAADCLDGEQWDSRILGKMSDDMRERIMKIAIETAIRL